MLHLPTLIVVSTLLNAFIGVFLLLVFYQRAQRSFLYWGLSCLVFSLAEISATLRVFIDLPVLTHYSAQLLMITAPLLVLRGILWYSSSKHHNPLFIYFILGFSALLLALLHHQPLWGQIYTSMAIATLVFAAAAAIRTTTKGNIYAATLLVLVTLHALVMLVQTGLLLTNLLHWEQSLPPWTKQLVLAVHLLLTICTALVFPMLFFIRSEAKLTNLANFDPLTNLYNRRAFFYEGEKRLAQCIAKQQPLAVMMIDLDYFKKVNDQFGHDGGDAALQWVSQRIREQLREDDLAARIGGEEFAVILANTHQRTALKVGDRLRKAIAEGSFYWHHQRLPLSISIGVTCRESGHFDIKKMLIEADKGLYEAKSRGRNCLVETHYSDTTTASTG